VTTAVEAIDEAEALIKASDAVDHPHAGKERVDAEELLVHVLGDEWEPDDDVGPDELRRFRALVRRRAGGRPPAYITGRTEFHGLVLEVAPGAFIPRQSSEFMVDQAVRRLRPRRGPVHVDLATGVGPVALAVARAVPRALVFGTDISSKPIALARRNAERLGIRNATFARGDLFAPLPEDLRGAVDAISVHPPYVPRGEVRELPREIRSFEPTESLTDFSRDGMGLLSRVVREASDWLRRGGWLLVEVSPDRARGVATALRRGGFAEVRSTKGPVAVSRVVVGRA
jgi:release factor glutamine methyltransferase